jgi:hypothetical protein
MEENDDCNLCTKNRTDRCVSGKKVEIWQVVRQREWIIVFKNVEVITLHNLTRVDFSEVGEAKT